MSYLVAILCLTAALAAATPIGPNCGTCSGAIFDLTYQTVSIGATNDVFDVTMFVDTTTYTGGGLYIAAVAPKVSPSVVSASLLNAPGGTGVWNTQLGGLNSGGCDGAGSGFVCSGATGHGAPVSNIDNSWIWEVVIPHGTLMTGDLQSSIKAEFTDINGNKVGALLSEGITLSPKSSVPEPSSLGLGAIGLILLGAARRFKTRRTT